MSKQILHVQMHSFLTDDVIKRLNQQKILTVLDILQKDAEKLASITKLLYKDVIQIRYSLASNYSSFPCNGMDVYNDLASNTARIATGIDSLDNILDGGLQTGNLYEICGLSGSGKTQLCLTISTNVARLLKQRVHYLDTKGDFSGKRIQVMLESNGCDDGEIELVMERIHVTRIVNVHHFHSFLRDMKSNNTFDEDGKSKVRIIIVDSLPVLYFHYLGGVSRDNLGLLNHMVNTMKYFAIENHIVFLLVNLVTRWYEDEILSNEVEDQADDKQMNGAEVTKPALGKFWLHVPSVRMSIQNNNGDASRQINIVKSINSLCGSCTLTLGKSGLTS